MAGCIGTDFLNYAPRTVDLVATTTLDDLFNQVPQYLGMGYDCALVRQYVFDELITAITVDPSAKSRVKPGQSFARPGAGGGGVTITWPPIVDYPVSTETAPRGSGVDIAVTVRKGNVSEDRGSLSIAYAQFDAAECVDNLPYAKFSQLITDNLTGSFPVVIGENGVTGINIFVTAYSGPPPWTGTVGCLDATTIFQDTITAQASPSLVTLSITYDAFVSTKDVEGMWCCLSAGYDCCGAPPIGNPYAPGFLIPPPPEQSVGEENVSQPPLNSLLFLTNHTFQFPNNFGVKKK